MEVRFIGKQWKMSNNETLDGFRVINVELELAAWEDNEPLFKYVFEEICGGFPLSPERIHESDLDKIIANAASEDIPQLMKVKEWQIKNSAYGNVEFDYS